MRMSPVSLNRLFNDPRQSISYDIIFAPNMVNDQTILLKSQAPMQQSLILILHFVYEHQWVMVSESFHWHHCCTQIHIKMLQS